MSILILSDYPSINEADSGPFSNGYWKYFRGQLHRAGINPGEFLWLNCFNKPAASLYSFTQVDKKGAVPGLPPLARKAWLRTEFSRDLSSVYSTVQRAKPNLIIACGEIPLLVLTHQTKLKFARGRITTTLPEAGARKVLPILHPRAVLSEIKQEPVLLMDLMKAKRQSAFPEVQRPQRWLHLRPTLEDLESFWQEYITKSTGLSVDIETKSPMITCVGISPSPDHCIVVPFFDEEKPSGNYWATLREEKIAWNFVRRCLNIPGTRVFGQNFSYDVQHFLRFMHIPVQSWTDDTMLMHHALQIEMDKGLGFLASIYSDELAWKFMHRRKASDRTAKKEDE